MAVAQAAAALPAEEVLPAEAAALSEVVALSLAACPVAESGQALLAAAR
jgi:hypothetical protein